MSEKQTEEKDGKLALGISFMGLGVSLGVTFALTLGWQFAPIGIVFVALGVVFMSQAKADEDEADQP